MMVRKISILFCLLMLTACTTTRSSSHLSDIVDPNYRGNFHAKKIVVMGLGMSIGEQKALENTLKQSFSKYNVVVLRGLDVFPPTRDYSCKDKYKIAKNKGADTLLIVKADRRNISKKYIRPEYHPGTSTRYVSRYGDSATVYTNRIPGYKSGGYSVSNPVMNVSVYLKNTKNKQTIWTAEGFSRGNGLASFSDLIVSIAKETVEKLSKAGLITTKKHL